LKATQARSYLFVFLGEISVWRDPGKKDGENIGPGEIFRLDRDTDGVHITAGIDSVIYHVDTNGLEKLVSWTVVSRLLEGDESTARRLNLLMNYSTLNILPVDAAFELSQRMIETSVHQGQEIVKQGEPADSFYVLTRGSADVWLQNKDMEAPRLVARLTAGDSFGEDALIAEGTRNATVTMTSDGQLLICKREDFQEIVAHRSIDEVSAREVRTMLSKNSCELIDVRYLDEYKEGYIENAVLIPLPDVRNSLGQFKQNKCYVLYCSNGKRSAIGAMILSRAGINAVSLKDGIENWPYETGSLVHPDNNG
jgi:rhodanese-related sulfurtransferase